MAQTTAQRSGDPIRDPFTCLRLPSVGSFVMNQALASIDWRQ
jgi:hypothetical protein